jgi:hypothetical protein
MNVDASVPNAARVYDYFLGGKTTTPSGSYLVPTQSTPDDVSSDVTEAMKDVYSGASAQVAPRSFEEIARFFDGLELIEPGLVNVTLWRPDLPSGPSSHDPRRSLIYGGVGRKP